jgi:putative membrane protein
VYEPYPQRSQRRIWPLILVTTVVFVVAVIAIVLYLDSVGAFGFAHAVRSGGFFYYGFFPILFVLFLVLILIRIVFWSWLWGSQGGRYGSRRAYRDPAVMTVRQRFARGEITREQYDQLMTDLGRRRRGP